MQARRHPEVGDEEVQKKLSNRRSKDCEPDEDRGDPGTQHHPTAVTPTTT